MVSNGDAPRRAPTLTVVMPAKDEAEGIQLAIDAADRALGALRRQGVLADFEILVVDDGSTDATAELVAAAAGAQPRLRLLRHDRNRGVGAALRTALGHLEGELVLWTDADMPVDLGELERALPLLRPDVAMVVGCRSTPGGEGRFRQVATIAYDRIMTVAAGPIPPDVNFPFKLLRTEDATGLPLQADGALVDVELCRLVQRDGRQIVSVEMAYRGRELGSSKTMSVRLLGRLLVELARRWRGLRHPPAPPG